MDRNRGLDINALRQQLEDLFEDFFPASQDRRRGHRGNDQSQHLPLNVAETDEAFTLTAPLPGYQPEEVDVTVRGQNVSVRAQHKTPPAGQETLTRHEWGFGTLQRSFELPAPVDSDATTATFRQGVVTVTLPKAAPADVTVEAADGEEDKTKEAAAETGSDTGAEKPTESAESGAAETTDDAEATPAATEKSSFYMAPGRGRRGRRHSAKNAERAQAESPEDVAVAETLDIGGAGESAQDENAAPATESEARDQDRDEQSGFGDSTPVDATDTAVSPEDIVVAEVLEMGGEETQPQETSVSEETTIADAANPESSDEGTASDAAAETFQEESERAAEPPTE